MLFLPFYLRPIREQDRFAGVLKLRLVPAASSVDLAVVPDAPPG